MYAQQLSLVVTGTDEGEEFTLVPNSNAGPWVIRVFDEGTDENGVVNGLGQD